MGEGAGCCSAAEVATVGTVGTGEEGGGGLERGEEEVAKREVVRGTVTVAGSKVPKLLWKFRKLFM